MPLSTYTRADDYTPRPAVRRRVEAAHLIEEAFGRLTDEQLAQPGIQLALQLLAQKMKADARDAAAGMLRV